MTSSLKLFFPYILILYDIKQIDSKLPWVFSVIDHRGRQNVVRTSVNVVRTSAIGIHLLRSVCLLYTYLSVIQSVRLFVCLLVYQFTCRL